MKIIDPGHSYLLDIFDGDGQHMLVFMKREGNKFPGNIGHYKGTNCQEVLRALIDRIKYLHNQIPNKENVIILRCLRESLLAFERRATERHKMRWVPPTENIEGLPICKVCGHIQCEHL